MTVTNKSEQLNRYRAIIDKVTSIESFCLADVKQQCNDERPGFVTRLINELARAGWLIHEDQTSDLYRWNSAKTFELDVWLQEKVVGTKITSSPAQDRPRERLMKVGAEQLKLSELLAILIRSGRAGESAVQAGEKLAQRFASSLEKLPGSRHPELKAISAAVGPTAYCQIMAGIELGRRISELAGTDLIPTRISSSSDAIIFCERHFDRLMTDASKEEFHIVTLDTKNQIIDTHQISVGTLDASLVHPREVFRAAIKDAASSIILVHNHPSGDPTPSREDHNVTTRLENVGETIGIDVLDHIVLGAFRSVSIRESR